MLRAIPTRRLTITPTRRRATAVARRRVGGKISNMLDISRRSSVARRFWSPGDSGRPAIDRPVAQQISHTHRVIGDRIGDRIGRRRPILSPITHKSPSGYGPLGVQTNVRPQREWIHVLVNYRLSFCIILGFYFCHL